MKAQWAGLSPTQSPRIFLLRSFCLCEHFARPLRATETDSERDVYCVTQPEDDSIMASFTQPEDDSVPTTVSTRPFDDDDYLGYDPRLPSQQFDSFVDTESLKDSATDSPIFHGSAADDAFATQPAPEAFSPPSIYAESNGQGFDGGFGGSDDPILPPPSEMLPEEGFALREWRSEAKFRKREKIMEIRSHDEDEVYEASRTGSVESLNRLIEKDPDILWRISLQTSKTGTPLHVSALHGHAEFTKGLCTNNPKLAKRVDADRRTPLHLASAEGHKEIVEALLSVYAGACSDFDENGRIPLHYAAMRGEVEVLQKLIDKNPESIYVKVENRSKETVLHLCIIHNQLECLKMLVERLLVERDDINGEFLNSKAGCYGGVTILNLALMLRQIKSIRYLLSVDAIRAEAVGVNGMSLTMLDILEYSSVAREDFSRSLEIQQILMEAGFIRRESNENDNPNSAVADAAAAAAVVGSPNPRRVKKKKKLRKQVAPSEKGSKPAGWFLTKSMNWLGYPDDWGKDTRGMLMVVATVISTMTFQAVVNPPGGVWDHNDTNTTFGNITVCNETSVCKAGTAVLSYGNDPRNYFPSFITYNTLSFLNSLAVTLLLVSGFPLYNRLYTWFLTIFICFTLAFLAFTYLTLLCIIVPDHRLWVSFIVYGVFYFPWIALLVIGGVLRFFNWVMKWSRPMYLKSTSSLKNIIITGSFSHNDPTRFEENEAPAVA